MGKSRENAGETLSDMQSRRGSTVSRAHCALLCCGISIVVVVAVHVGSGAFGGVTVDCLLPMPP